MYLIFESEARMLLEAIIRNSIVNLLTYSHGGVEGSEADQLVL